MLQAQDIALEEPLLVARTAWTTDELMDAVDEAAPTPPFDLVTVLAGVNDQYRARPLEQFAGDYGPLLDLALRMTGNDPARVIAMSIPDWGATPFAEGRDRDLITREVDQYNERAATLAAKRAIRWHDVTTMTRAMRTDPSLVVADGLHPSAAMYRQWAESLVPLARAVLARGRVSTG